jgi:hypothetical protein
MKDENEEIKEGPVKINKNVQTNKEFLKKTRCHFCNEYAKYPFYV